MTPRLVCFDINNVLVRIATGWSHAVTIAGLPTGDPAHVDVYRRPDLGPQVHALERGEISPEAFAEAVAPLVGRSVADVLLVLDRWLIEVYPGAVQLLDELAARNVPIACLSNTNLRHWEIMSAWNSDADRLWSRLQHRYASHELRLRKPDVEIYARVEDAVKAIATPQEIVFFDDLSANVAAATARGWQAHHVESTDNPVAEMRAVLVRLSVL